MSLRRLLPSLLLCASIVVAATGCHSDAGVAASTPDLSLADMTPPPDLTPSPYPSVQTPDVPQATSQGGPVLTSPQVVVVTFPGEDSLTQIDDFVSTIGATDYWAAVTSQYGVGKLSLLTNVAVATAPAASITDDDIQTFLGSMLDGTHPEWPQPTDNTIYALFYPAATVIDDGNGSVSCQDFGGYHADTGIASSNNRVVYAVLPRCSDTKLSTINYLTVAASHEFIESSNDPYPFTDPAYEDVDDNHFTWSRVLGGGGETGDLCEFAPDAEFQPAGFPYYVQRAWSNIAATAGQDPCVPAAPSPAYFNITPMTARDSIALTFGGGGGSFDTQGWTIPVGATKTYEFQIYSDASTGPITVEAVDTGSGQSTTSGAITFTWDKTTGVNGEALHLSITANKASTSHSGLETMEITSRLGSTEHQWIGAVQITPAATTTTSP